MAILNHIRTQDYSSRASGGKSTNGDKSEYSSVSPTIDKLKEKMEQNKTLGGSPGSFGTTSKPSTGSTGTGTLPGIGENTGESSSVDEYLKLLNGSGSYDDSYWTKNNNFLIGVGNNAMKKANEHESAFKSLLESYKSENPLSTDWGKALLSQYGLTGDEMARNEQAESAASNSGNIDSYAEANARRQKLSYLNSGVNAVNDMSNQRFANMLGTLEKMGVNTQNLFGIASDTAQSGMNAAANRYANDTEATIADYNAQISGASDTGSSDISDSQLENMISLLQNAYKEGGEKGLLSAGNIYLKKGVNSDLIGSIVDYISGESAGDYESKEWYSIPEFRQYFENSEDNSGITGLPSWVQQRLRQEAEAKGISANKYAQGILSGDYEYPSWLKQVPYAD